MKGWVFALAATLAGGMPTYSAAAEVYVVVNGVTGEVVVGTDPEWVASQSIQRVAQGWDQLFGDDVEGWASVGCTRNADGSYHFEIASGHATEAEARRLALAASRQFVSRYSPEATVLEACGYTWNNIGGPVSLGPSVAKP